MANICAVCGKGPQFGQNIRHVHSGYPPARATGFLLGCNLACRADVLSRCAFPDQTIGEDVIFAAAVRAAGYRLIWAPAVEVKGATLTALSVDQGADGSWTAQCVIDV